MRTLPCTLVFIALTMAAARFAVAHDCPDPGATIESLHHCVRHAYDMGHIDNAGVLKSLLAKLDAAQDAVGRQQPAVAISLLEAFIAEVQAQSGQHIDPEHASHMVDHAGIVIAALSS